MMISANWGELLLPGLKKIFDKHQKQLKDFVPALYNVEKSTKAQEFTLETGSLGLMEEWNASGRQVAYEDINKGFMATYTHRKYSKGIEIERELLEDDQYAEIKKRVRKLSTSVYYTRQFHAARPFNMAFDPAFPGPDGVPLCSDNHPLSPGSPNTWSNLGQGQEWALNADNVERARTMMMGWTDDKGNLLAVNPDTLIVPPALRKAALVIADSDKEPSTNFNDINVWKGNLNVIEFPFLTNPNNWFLVDMQRMKQFLNWFDRRIATLEKDRENFDTEVARYKTVARFSYGWDNASFIFGANPQ